MLAARGLCLAPPGAPDPVVRDLSLDVGPGEWVAVGGPNGCGKTSLALALGGLASPRRGTVTWEGAPLERVEARRAVSVVLQEPASQLFQSTVAGELAFTARNLGQDEGTIAAEALALARRAGLEADLGRDPATLSAGRQQLVLLLAALVPRPRLLVADEPGAHLDGRARSTALALVRERVREGLAVVWVTQEPAEVEAADRIIDLGGSAPGNGPDRGRPSVRAAGNEVGSGAPFLVLSVAARADEAGPRVAAAGGLELEIRDRGVVALVGPNGCGKSVLLSAAAGLEVPPQIARRWSGSPQPPPLMAGQYPELQIFEERVADELGFAALRRGTSIEALRKTIERWLIAAGYDPGRLLERRTWTLSAGEKRLISVLGALVAPARLVALDEPTAGLDTGRRGAVAGWIRERAQETSVLVATQDEGWLAGIGAETIRLGVPDTVSRSKSKSKNGLTEP